MITIFWKDPRIKRKNNLGRYVELTQDNYQGVDKSLAWSGKKEATATKLQLLQATQKQIRRLSVQPGLRGSNDLRFGRKMATFQLFFFSSRIGLRTYQHPAY